MGSESDEGSFNGMWVWNLDTIPQVKTFIWQCLHNAIGVGECLVKRCITETDICPLCQREPETILHRLRDCGTSKQIWERLGVRQNSNFYEGNLVQWLEYNCKNNTCRLGEQPPWTIIFPFAIWLLWKHRNATIFRNLHAQPNVHKDALFRALEFQHCGLNNKKLGSKRVVQVRWERPQVGWASMKHGCVSGLGCECGKKKARSTSEVRISAYPASFKANFGLFQLFPANFDRIGRIGRRPIRPDMANTARFRPNQPDSTQIEADSARIKPRRRESSRVGANLRKKKKKKTQRGTNARSTASDATSRVGALRTRVRHPPSRIRAF
uniref:Reverse transcriptase zinc-binding domain-containing protein n=1 Tax=Quercus lobata TaxID=97700 RepID=A0A7N2MK81_QUELO